MRILIVSGIWPPDVGGPASHAPEVAEFLQDKVELAVRCGIPAERIIVDPGLDLNKNTHHSLELIRRLGEIAALGHPLLVAVSNKDFIGETLARISRRDEEGTTDEHQGCHQRSGTHRTRDSKVGHR